MKKILLLVVSFMIIFSAYSQPGGLKKLDINLENYQYPYPVKFLKLHNQLQELQMAYMDVKPANYNGKNIILLHGKNFNGAYWRSTIAALSTAGFRVIVPDQVGFGKSTKPKAFQYTFQQLALNTKTLLDILGIDKITVLGHSMGGMIAARFALMYPGTTEKLILEDPLGLEDWKLKVPYTSINSSYEKELKSNYESVKKYQVDNYYHGTWKKEYDEWAKLLAGWTLNKDYKIIAWNSALTSDMIFTQPVCYEFQNITCPTLLIVGTLDKTAIGKPLVSEEVRKTMGDYKTLGKTTRDKIPNATLVEIEGVGHLPHIEAFEQFIKPVIAFLEK
ncbi:MAG TPA: alpha/beta hydrolase [Hanamia sp.]|nr:alpha/beta hydrolase [Hanamia sp.]